MRNGLVNIGEYLAIVKQKMKPSQHLLRQNPESTMKPAGFSGLETVLSLEENGDDLGRMTFRLARRRPGVNRRTAGLQAGFWQSVDLMRVFRGFRG